MSVKKHMDEHFTRVREVESAVVRGDLDDAKVPAQWIADHQETAGLPAGSDAYVASMKSAASAIVAASDLNAAARSAATLVAACGECHAASKVTAHLPMLTRATRSGGRKTHMAEHQDAVNLLYRGLVAPSDADWKKGAKDLKTAPLGELALRDVPKEQVEAEANVHALADRALAAADAPAKAAVYGEIIGGCANCHGLHGRVFGPGLPRAE